jgi:hypothetical protein
MSIMEALTFPGFQAAAAAVATFELRVRMLADQGDAGTPLVKAALSAEFTKLIDDVCAFHGASDEDARYLKACAGMRNKLFHLELSRVTGRIRPLSEQLREGGVWSLDIETGEVQTVAKTKTEDGRIFGWMLESSSSGAFEAVVAAMRKASGIIEAMRDRAYGDEGAPDVGAH